jgi:hypothetical protein
MKLVITEDTVAKPGTKQRKMYGAEELKEFSRNQVISIISHEVAGGSHVKVFHKESICGRTDSHFWAPHIRIEGTEPGNNPTEAAERIKAVTMTTQKQIERPYNKGKSIYLVGVGERHLNEPIDGCKDLYWYEATRNGERIPEYRYQSLNIIDIAQKLQILRDQYLDSRPLIITSWLRPEAINRAIGGSSLSTHISGGGVDWYVETLHEQEIYDRINPHWKYGLAVSARGRFVHIDNGRNANDELYNFVRRWQYG